MDSEMYNKDEITSPLTLKIIMIGKEVGSIIGKKGEIVKRFREESGAKINISDGSCPERIVTVSGNTEAVAKAFTFICAKIEEFQNVPNQDACLNQQSVVITVKLIIPACQCGSLIGKGGSKIKEIRQSTGATIQVASDMLPNSTERAVIVAGTKESVIQCIFHICSIIQESPPKSPTIPYQPKPYLPTPMLLAGGQSYQTYTLQGLASAAGAAVTAPSTTDVSTTIMPPGCGSTLGGPYSLLLQPGMGITPLAVFDPLFKNGHLQAAIPHIFPPAVSEIGRIGPPLSGLTSVGIGNIQPSTCSNLNVAALAAVTGNPIRNRAQEIMNQTHEMTVPNDLIGCIIGKGGNKIAEIRQISGAIIRISNCEDRENFENVERTVTITGNPDSVAIAQYLINVSLEQQKLNIMLQNISTDTTACTSTTNSISTNVPGMAQSDIPTPPPPLAPAIPTSPFIPVSDFLSIPTPLLTKPNMTMTYNNNAAATAFFIPPNLNLNTFGNFSPVPPHFMHNHSNITTPALTSSTCSNQQFIKQQSALMKQHQQQQEKVNLFRMNDIKFRPY